MTRQLAKVGRHWVVWTVPDHRIVAGPCRLRREAIAAVQEIDRQQALAEIRAANIAAGRHPNAGPELLSRMFPVGRK